MIESFDPRYYLGGLVSERLKEPLDYLQSERAKPRCIRLLTREYCLSKALGEVKLTNPLDKVHLSTSQPRN